MATETKRDYGYRKRVALGFDEALARVKATLAEQGFGTLTQIDVGETLKAKIGADLGRRYVILGVCKPTLAYQALQAETELGLLLPCNVIVYEDGDETVVSAIEPLEALAVADVPELQGVAEQAAAGLHAAIDNL